MGKKSSGPLPFPDGTFLFHPNDKPIAYPFIQEEAQYQGRVFVSNPVFGMMNLRFFFLFP